MARVSGGLTAARSSGRPSARRIGPSAPPQRPHAADRFAIPAHHTSPCDAERPRPLGSTLTTMAPVPCRSDGHRVETKPIARGMRPCASNRAATRRWGGGDHDNAASRPRTRPCRRPARASTAMRPRSCAANGRRADAGTISPHAAISRRPDRIDAEGRRRGALPIPTTTASAPAAGGGGECHGSRSVRSVRRSAISVVGSGRRCVRWHSLPLGREVHLALLSQARRR